jgi:hypothetical protein
MKMRLSENWATAGLKNQLEFQKESLEFYKNRDQKLYGYHKGIVKGLEMAMEEIEKAYQN